jgi:DNA invertase Pin-like site-specific DNA recombinase
VAYLKTFSKIRLPQVVTYAARYGRNYRLGYARVSNYGQTLDAQLEQLRSAGCTNRNIYREKVTGARDDRSELLRMLGRLGPGDLVTVARI